ncbi:MAG: SusC/RagA family TonB-linked outer membrane protein [Tannerellaceae bacterium]|nr:SusC/RagA family TonB-linked outer membrane protein [Tannerellaceae bacterium]
MKKFLMLTVACLLVGVAAFAQTKTITGKVIGSDDELGVPASVQIKGTAKGVSADIDGNYSIVAEQGQTLVFSAIGYTVQEIVVGDANEINVTLQGEATQLTEAVVTALGITKEKKALGYSVQDLKSEELLKNKTANPLNSLAGKVAGVNITQSSGAAGSGAHIILRGGTSLDETRDNQPLFVVDGIIYDNSTSVVGNSSFDGMGGSATTFSNRVMDVNPEDIENMSVLKGPAAAALYGSRAANGVIMITTKKGTEGTVSVDFSSKFSTAWASRLPETQTTYGRGSYRVDGTLNPNDYVVYNSWGYKLGDNQRRYNNIENFFQTSTIFDNTVSVSGGSKNGSFYFSASNYDQKGIVPNTGYVKNTFRFNGEQKYGKLTLNVGAAYSQANTDKTLTSAGLYLSDGTGTMLQVYRWAINEDMTKYLNDDGTKYIFPQYLDANGERDLNKYPLGSFVENPYWLVNKNKMTDQTNRFTGNAAADFKVFDWWNLTYRAGIDRYTTGNKNIIAPGGEIKSDFQEGMLSENFLDFQYLSYTLMSNMDKKFGDFNVGLMLGFGEEETKTESNYRMATNPSEANFPSFGVSTDENKKFSQSHTKTRMRSFFGEFRASYKNIAYLTITGRNDKNSTLYSPLTGDENASYFYPSVGGSVIFSELLPDNLRDIISFGKVRASWAQVGKGTTAYATSTSLWDFQNFIGGFTGTTNYWYRGNPYLKPEMTTSIELGLEMRFLNGRLGFDYTYYSNVSKDQILNPRTSQATGYIFNYSNIGELYNKGMELSITGQPIKTKDLVWNATLNIAGNRSTVGTIHTSLPILYVTSVQPGNAKAASFENGVFMGISGQKWKRTEDGKLILSADGMPTSDNVTTHFVGDREPRFTGGLNNSIQYKGWNLAFLLEFRVGGYVYNGTEYWMTANGMATKTENREKLIINGVVNTAPDGQTPVYVDKEFTFYANGMYNMNNDVQSGKYVIQQYWASEYLKETANFLTKTNWLRLRSISLSYTLPKELLAKVKFIKGCTVSATGTNLLLITNYKGLDPEAVASGSGVGGSSSVGIEYCNVPATAGLSFGINLKF